MLRLFQGAPFQAAPFSGCSQRTCRYYVDNAVSIADAAPLSCCHCGVLLWYTWLHTSALVNYLCLQHDAPQVATNSPLSLSAACMLSPVCAAGAAPRQGRAAPRPPPGAPQARARLPHARRCVRTMLTFIYIHLYILRSILFV
jgi:hypothetical protein